MSDSLDDPVRHDSSGPGIDGSPSRRRNYSVVASGVLVGLVGVVWFGQGMGWIGGSVMTGVTFWALVGPVVVLLGAWLVRRGLGGGKDAPQQ